MRRLLVMVLALAAFAAAGGGTAAPAGASGVTVLGAGSTWDQIATTQWEADVKSIYGITINYEGVGSSAGRQFYIENQVDFGDSDIPFQTLASDNEVAQLNSEHKTWQYLPTVAGATGIMYNLHTPSGKRITNLQLDSNTLTGIFTGTITSWTDPRILRLNPKLRGQLPPTGSQYNRIIPVVRSDGSGTSAMFSDYLRQLQPSQWRAFCSKYPDSFPDGCGQTSYWPTSIPGAIAQKGSDGVANFVQQNYSTVTYVETGYAIERNFPVALVRNQSGHFVFPSATNDAAALTHAHILPDLISDLSGVHVAPEANAYPIAGYSYMITPTKVQFGFTTAKGAVLGRFILYAACAGQRKAASLGYAPLTPVLVRGVFAAVRRIPGAPAPPPLSHCDNPTITGGGDTGPTGNPGGSGTNSPPTSSGTNGGANPSKTNSGGKTHSGSGGKAKSTTAATQDNTEPGVAPTVGVVLTSYQLSTRRAAALAALGHVGSASSTPLGLAAVDALVIALLPFLGWQLWRRRPWAGRP
ncbi:MAG: substrate-binding domain-containing protein [Gaiellales bacterium]